MNSFEGAEKSEGQEVRSGTFIPSHAPSGGGRLGFYLHTSWEFSYPFAVRSWKREDFSNWFKLLRALDFDTVMIWPLSEAMPAPLSEADAAVLARWRQIVEDAQANGLECWLTFCANVSANPEIAKRPFAERHLYPFRNDVRLDDEHARSAYLAHRARLFEALDNADAYVTIDGDPGGYPGARPEEFVRVLQHDRATLDNLGRTEARIVPWLWSGWGSDWGANGVWSEPLEPLAGPVLKLLKTRLAGPWELLPGRHMHDDRGNGRIMLQLAERAGLLGRSTLLCYEVIEFEPTPPAVVLQFTDIRRVLRQEQPLTAMSRGLMGNAQQPVMALPNLYFFARCARDAAYLERTDEEVLTDLAQLLGGETELLVPAWRCLQLPLELLPEQLPQRLRDSRLTRAIADCLPGGSRNYLEILGQFVEARRGVLEVCAASPNTVEQAAETVLQAITHLVRWWNLHHYVFSGENGTTFKLEFCHPELVRPLWEWMGRNAGPIGKALDAGTLQAGLCDVALMGPATAAALVADLGRCQPDSPP